jgi:hypothetical protein
MTGLFRLCGHLGANALATADAVADQWPIFSPAQRRMFFPRLMPMGSQEEGQQPDPSRGGQQHEHPPPHGPHGPPPPPPPPHDQSS